MESGFIAFDSGVVTYLHALSSRVTADKKYSDTALLSLVEIAVYAAENMNPVLQDEPTGCGIASAAAIAGISYEKARKIAHSLGIHAKYQSLWSDTKHVRRLLGTFGLRTDKDEIRFKSWDALPCCALLAIKWRMAMGKAYWHWVVFVREDNKQYVLDSRKTLKNNIRTDFGRMKPKWYIEVHAPGYADRIPTLSYLHQRVE